MKNDYQILNEHPFSVGVRNPIPLYSLSSKRFFFVGFRVNCAALSTVQSVSSTLSGAFLEGCSGSDWCCAEKGNPVVRTACRSEKYESLSFIFTVTYKG